MNIKKYVSNEIKSISNIDCIGITCRNGRISEAKTYRYPKKESKGDVLSTFCSSTGTKKEHRNYFKLKTNNINEMMQNIDLFFCENNIELDSYPIKRTVEIIEKSLVDGKRHLTQIGNKKMGEMTNEIKVYFTLRKFAGESDVRGVSQRYEENKKIFQELYHLFNVEYQARNRFSEVAKLVEKDGYYPSLIGINYASQYLEYKLYYELFSEKYNFADVLKNNEYSMNEVCGIYNWKLEEIVNVIQYFDSQEFFLRGFAISICNGKMDGLLRMYFVPKNRFQ